MSIIIDDQQSQPLWSNHECAICGSKAIGVNFGALTCGPCKAFFRRNARRKEILELPCHHPSINFSIINNNNKPIRCSQIRRCTPCRLHRCFDIGMKEELVRTHEENLRHKQLVDINRRRREFLRQKQQEKLLSLPQSVATNNRLLSDSDWRHLSNIVSAYETHCLRTYAQQRSTMFLNQTPSYTYGRTLMKHYAALPMSLTSSLFSFLQSLPAFHSLSQINRTYVNKNNLRSLIFSNMFELNQTCYSEPWQISLDKNAMQFMCGSSELYEEFVRVENLAERILITDPTITRLWLVILFFSSSLSCVYDKNLLVRIPKRKNSILEIQDAYVTLLWNYLLYRYGNDSAIQIYSNLVHVYLQMKPIGYGIGVQVRTRNELMITDETLNQVLTLDIRDS